MTQKSVIFENEGLIDIRAIKTFGVNVKETENPFGFFGTGLKYAIAIILRNHCSITIHRGSETYEFALKTTDIRGKEFSIVTMNGEELGFTSELGKNWKLWQAFRELYCNTLDEEGHCYASVVDKETAPVLGKTIIVVSGEAFLSTYIKRREFILQSEPLEVINNVEIHEGSANGFFYKGIFIEGLNSKSRYTYNFLSSISLTEDRTLKTLFSAEYEVVKAIIQSENEDVIRVAVGSIKTAAGYFEEELHFNYPTYITPSDTFMKVMAELLKDYSIDLNDSARKLYRKYAGGEEERPTPAVLTTVQHKQLEKAILFSIKLGLFNKDEFPIVITETLGQGILGLAKYGTIYIALASFEEGTKTVAHALIEEYVHLKYNHADMTRGMQSFLFKKLITLGEEINGEPL